MFSIRNNGGVAVSDKIKIAAIVGPTASGKTALSIALAKLFDGEIVSCDSMQVYKRMNIGTAKPTLEEMDGVPHHLIDIAEPDRIYSCAEYVSDAKNVINDIVSRGKLPIVCGGTGLYLDSLLRGGSFEVTDTDDGYRRELMQLASDKGNCFVHDMLKKVDPESASAIHQNNVKRVIRALEIYKTTGHTKTELDARSRENDSEYDALVIGIRYDDREVLYERIDKRVDIMLETGLENEIKELIAEGVFDSSGTATQAIGYKELFGYIKGETSYEDAVSLLKQSTRRYAKRQLTWFSNHSNVVWIDVKKENNFEQILNIAQNLFNNFI